MQMPSGDFKWHVFTLFPSMVSLLQEIIPEKSHESKIQRSQEAAPTRSSSTGKGGSHSTRYTKLLSDHPSSFSQDTQATNFPQISTGTPTWCGRSRGRALSMVSSHVLRYHSKFSTITACPMVWPFSLEEIRKSFKQLSVFKAVAPHYAPAHTGGNWNM